MKNKNSNNEKSIHIRDFSRIKPLFSEIYIYGCYSKEDIIKNIHNVGKTKYTDEINRISEMFGEDFFANEKVEKLKRPHFYYDRYYNIANYLIKSYKIKSYTEKEFRYYFYILQCIQCLDKPLEAIELQGEIDSYFDEEIEIDRTTFKRKLDDLVEVGFVQEKDTKYFPVNNFLEDLTEKELQSLIQALYFFRGITPLSSQGIFAIETIKEFIKFKEIDVKTKDIYLYVNSHFSNILNDNDIYNIICAINDSKTLKITKEKVEFEAVPLKILEEHKYGRQYLLCYDLSKKRPTNILINDISSCKITENSFNIEDYKSSLDLIEKSYSMSQLYALENPLEQKPVLVEVEFSFDNKKICHEVREKVITTKRQGTVEQISDTNFVYKIEVLSPKEMIPYIRSFGHYAKVKKSEHHNLYEEINEDWSNLKKAYGIV